MKPQTHPILIAIMVVVYGLSPLKAQITTTDTFGSGANSFSIDFVTVGNAGNANDNGDGGGIYSSPFGGVGYEYRIGTYEISQDIITMATTLGLANVTAGAHAGNRPAADMGWFEKAAFVNWLNTTKGHQAAYNLAFSGSWSMTLWGASDQASTGVRTGTNPFRHKDAYYFLPSEDEWYKAAFHKNDGVTANYWDYATGSNSAPTAVANGTLQGTAVYKNIATYPAAVNESGGLSPYGTMGQNGNVAEQLEEAFDGGLNTRIARGGYWKGGEDYEDASRRHFLNLASNENLGFRVASVPEPSTYALLLVAGAGAIWWVRRRRDCNGSRKP